jgi:hypothetical protein
MADRYRVGEARWATLHTEDPDGREAGKQAERDREQRRRRSNSDEE